MVPPRIELLVHRVEIISENSFKARAVEEERRLLRFVRIHPSSRHGEGNEEKVKNKSDKATAVGSSFPRTQPLAFGLLSTFFRGLRTASSQERLTLLAKNTPSLSRQPLLPPPPSLVPIPPLSSFSFSPPPFLRHVVVIVDVTIVSSPFLAPSPPSRSLFLFLFFLELWSAARGTVSSTRRKRGMEKDSHHPLPSPLKSRALTSDGR